MAGNIEQKQAMNALYRSIKGIKQTTHKYKQTTHTHNQQQNKHNKQTGGADLPINNYGSLLSTLAHDPAAAGSSQTATCAGAIPQASLATSGLGDIGSTSYYSTQALTNKLTPVMGFSGGGSGKGSKGGKGRGKGKSGKGKEKSTKTKSKK